MKIVVIGTGYVGLVTGACLADSGHTVVCVDNDDAKIAILHQNEIPIYEPGLKDLVSRNTRAQRLSFTTNMRAAVAGVDVVFLAVGTPQGEDGAADLRVLFSVAEAVADALTAPCVVVTKSTVPVGTGRKLLALLNKRSKHAVEIASNPEFLKEGDALNDFMKPDRVVVGCESAHAREVMRHIYEPFVRTENPILFMDLESSELSKYVANAFLATRISFMNEMAHLAAALGADIDTVRKSIGHDRRIGHLFMFPGVGYGGSCFPKDVQALSAIARGNNLNTPLLDAVEEINRKQKQLLVVRLRERLGDLKGKVIALWGLSFKPRTDDIREAPALTIIDALLASGAHVRVTDPAALENGRRLYSGKEVIFSEDPYSVLEGADAWLLVTEWQEFRRPDFHRIRQLMRGNVVLDGRNVYDPKAMRALGFDYQGIGRH